MHLHRCIRNVSFVLYYAVKPSAQNSDKQMSLLLPVIFLIQPNWFKLHVLNRSLNFIEKICKFYAHFFPTANDSETQLTFGVIIFSALDATIIIICNRQFNLRVTKLNSTKKAHRLWLFLTDHLYFTRFLVFFLHNEAKPPGFIVHFVSQLFAWSLISFNWSEQQLLLLHLV